MKLHLFSSQISSFCRQVGVQLFLYSSIYIFGLNQRVDRVVPLNVDFTAGKHRNKNVSLAENGIPFDCTLTPDQPDFQIRPSATSFEFLLYLSCKPFFCSTSWRSCLCLCRNVTYSRAMRVQGACGPVSFFVSGNNHNKQLRPTFKSLELKTDSVLFGREKPVKRDEGAGGEAVRPQQSEQGCIRRSSTEVPGHCWGGGSLLCRLLASQWTDPDHRCLRL